MNHHLGQINEVECLFQVDYPFADVVVFCEEISIISLNHKLCFSPWRLDVKKHTVVERALAVHTSVVSVSLELFLVVYVSFDIDIRCALKVHRRYVLCVHNTQAHLVVPHRFRVKFPLFV